MNKYPGKVNPEILVAATLFSIHHQDTDVDPLQAALQVYTHHLATLDVKEIQQLKHLLAARVCDELELETRFLLRLISDTTDSILENRPVPYLQIA